ncbi:hypothetical protein C9374_008049 [Naegleria lovaniensis]|uniref:Uncharacterized protein n=1 Tax=Naegleria lovaniensis TaxID=51637 RepID=A0AA88GKL0_NAELO|nr:uncharacterized protein C9374_008049 [Naegleria lovaniensis]KAG2378901.1 hypothetical protein C9374_008049 [Naegleria lovaniensis]
MSKRPKQEHDFSLHPSDNSKKAKTIGNSFENPIVLDEPSQKSPPLGVPSMLESTESLFPLELFSEGNDHVSTFPSSLKDVDSVTTNDDANMKKASSSSKKRTGKTHDNTRHTWSADEDNILVSVVAGSTMRNNKISWVHAFPAFQNSMKEKFDEGLTSTAIRKRFIALMTNHEMKNSMTITKKEISYETALALTSDNADNKYFPQAVGTLDYFAINVRNLAIYYLDRYGWLDSSFIQQKPLNSLKGLGKIFAFEPRLLAMEGIDTGHIGTFMQQLTSGGYDCPNQQFYDWFKKMCMDRVQSRMKDIILPQDTEFVVRNDESFHSLTLAEMLKVSETPSIIGIKVEDAKFVGEFSKIQIEAMKTTEYGILGTEKGTFKGFSDHQHKNCRILCEEKLIRKEDTNRYYVISRHNKQFEKVSKDTMNKVWGEQVDENLQSASKSSLLYSTTVQDPGKYIRRAHLPFDLKMNDEEKLRQRWIEGPKFFLGKDEQQIFDWVCTIAKLLFPNSSPSRLKVFSKVLHTGNTTANDEDKIDEDQKIIFQEYEPFQVANSDELMNRFRSMIPPKTNDYHWYHFKKEKDNDVIKHVIAVTYGSSLEENLLQHGYEPMMLVVWFQHQNWIPTMKEIQALDGTMKHFPSYWYFASKTFSLGFLLGFTYGDGHKEKYKNQFSVGQKDICALHLLRWYCCQHGMSSSSLYESKGVHTFRFYGPGLVHFTDHILKKKSKDGDPESVPRILSIACNYDSEPKEEKIMVRVSVLDPSVQFLVTARGAVYNVGKDTFIHSRYDISNGFHIIQKDECFTKAVPSYIMDLLQFNGNEK